jgi:hypothetical protein
MKTRVQIRIEEPGFTNEQGDFACSDVSCALCSFVFEREMLTCMAYVTYDSCQTEEALGRVCLQCRDAGPETIRKQLRAQAEIHWLQEPPEPVCIYLKS